MNVCKVRSRTLVPMVFGLIAVLGGCSGDGTNRDPDATEEAAQAVTPKDEAAGSDSARRPPPGGPEMLVAAALHELDLTDAQRSTIEAALAKLHGDRRGPDGHRAAMTELAREVRSGRVDTEVPGLNRVGAA